MAELPTPSFLQNHSTNENHEKMVSILPADIDISEGGHVWNMTRPTALLAAELCEFILPKVISLILPEYSYGDILDGHARQRALTRRAAKAATGEITITGTANTVIPEGSLFSTASVNGEPSVEYETTESATIPGSLSVTVPIRCREAGVIGNTAANTIIFGSLSGIESITNENEVAGGIEEESDEALIERIMDYDKSQGDNFVGSYSDYKRWAMSVEGVGSATVESAKDDSGLVKIIITDSNGQPATELLCEKVYNYIMSPDDPEARLAPINAILSVEKPSTMSIFVKATVELTKDATIESAKDSFISKLTAYLPTAMEDKEIKYTKIFSALSSSDGVNDFSDLLIGVEGGTYSASNITIDTSRLPVVSADNIELTVGTV